jgi:hypothetical protein
VKVTLEVCSVAGMVAVSGRAVDVAFGLQAVSPRVKTRKPKREYRRIDGVLTFFIEASLLIFYGQIFVV